MYLENVKGGGEGNFSLSFNLFPFLCNFTISLTSLYIQILVRRTGGVRLGIFTYDLRGGEGCLLIYYILKDIKREAFVDYNIGEGVLGCRKINTIFNFGDQIFFYKWNFYCNSFFLNSSVRGEFKNIFPYINKISIHNFDLNL